MAKAQLLAFSGAENPARALNREEMNAVRKAIELSLERAPDAVEPPPSLGGVAIEFEDEELVPFVLVIARDGVVTVFWKDESRPPTSKADVEAVESVVRYFVRDLLLKRTSSSSIHL